MAERDNSLIGRWLLKRQQSATILLAGGLTPENVSESHRQVRPVRRGCQQRRRSKSRQEEITSKVQAFVQAVRLVSS